MNYEKVLVVDKDGKQNEWMIENDYKDTYTIYRLGTLRTLYKSKCYEFEGKLFSRELADVITREDEEFKECIEKCHICGEDIYDKKKLVVDKDDHYICKKCAKKNNIKVRDIGDLILT